MLPPFRDLTHFTPLRAKERSAKPDGIILVRKPQLVLAEKVANEWEFILGNAGKTTNAGTLRKNAT
jgi:hypothetical protein